MTIKNQTKYEELFGSAFRNEGFYINPFVLQEDVKNKLIRIFNTTMSTDAEITRFKNLYRLIKEFEPVVKIIDEYAAPRLEMWVSTEFFEEKYVVKSDSDEVWVEHRKSRESLASFYYGEKYRFTKEEALERANAIADELNKNDNFKVI